MACICYMSRRTDWTAWTHKSNENYRVEHLRWKHSTAASSLTAFDKTLRVQLQTGFTYAFNHLHPI